MQDQALLTAWASGRDERAFEALFCQYYPLIYRVLYRLVGEEADDIAQQVFLQLYRRPPVCEGSDLSAWLCRVATRLGYNALRAGQRRDKYRDALGVDTSGAGWQPEEPEPEMAAEKHQLQGAVRTALRLLRRREATILTLRYSGLAYREIAEVVGVRPSSVGTLLARAERAFAAAYAKVAPEAAWEETEA